MANNPADPFAMSPDPLDSVSPSKPIEDSPGFKQFAPGALVLERYRVISVLGHGAFGTVYKVNQIYLKKDFALKVLNQAMSGSRTVIRRFQKEAEAASRLEHANVVRAVDFGLINDCQPFLVMECVEGETLNLCLKREGHLSEAGALQIFIPLCSALGYAHEQGIVHRDLKPSNIILARTADGALIPKIIDFGIAKLEHSDTEALTRTGEIFGTPLYMSPEQCAGERVDNRSDIYSLGCVVFEALTGAPPIKGATALETMMRHSTANAPSLREGSLGMSFTKELEAVVAKMLAKLPEKRYQSAFDLEADLVAIQQGRPIPAGNDAASLTLGPGKPWWHSRKAWIGGLCGCLLVGIGLVGGAQLTTVSQTPKPSPVESALKETKADDAPGFLNDQKFFSRVQNGMRIFNFPPSHDIGEFIYWPKGAALKTPTILKARGEIFLPEGTHIVYKPGVELAEKPYYSRYFRNGDFSGLVWDMGPFTVLTDLDRSLNDLILIKSLQHLCVKGSVLPTTLSLVGQSDSLKSLTLISPNVPVEAVAELPNLCQLRSLALFELSNMRPVLKKLSESSHIERLALPQGDLTPETLNQVLALHSLRMLDLSNNPRLCGAPNPSERDCVKLLNRLSGLKDLCGLNIDANYILAGQKTPPASVLKALSRFSRLRSLAIFDPTCSRTVVYFHDQTQYQGGVNSHYWLVERSVPLLRTSLPQNCDICIAPYAFALSPAFMPNGWDPDRDLSN